MAITATFQWPDRVRGLNFYQTDRNLQRFLLRSASAMLARRQQALESFGAYCGGEMDAKAALFEDAKIIETQPNPWTYPSLDLVKSIRLDPDYVTAYQELYRRDFLAPCLTDTDPESNIRATDRAIPDRPETDIGISCPWAMSHPRIATDRGSCIEGDPRPLSARIAEDGFRAGPRLRHVRFGTP